MRKYIILFLFGYVATFFNCQKEYDKILSIHPENKVMVYFNSFEALKDTTNERFIEADTVINSGAPSCGKQAFHIVGGCIQPALQFQVVAPLSGQYEMGIWTRLKDTAQTGQIMFGSQDENQSVVIPVVEEEWVYSLSDRLQDIKKGDTLNIDFLIGGFIAAEMWIDCLSVEAIPD